MFNAKFIIPGVLVFLVLFSAPFWLNIGSGSYKRPEIALPVTEKECVEPREYMAAEHMQLLDTWRDMALREEKRTYVSTSGKVWNISLQNTCMTCHTDKAGFCDKCHDANSVDPYCWDCHVEPRGKK
jgi:hypothetical protein